MIDCLPATLPACLSASFLFLSLHSSFYFTLLPISFSCSHHSFSHSFSFLLICFLPCYFSSPLSYSPFISFHSSSSSSSPSYSHSSFTPPFPLTSPTHFSLPSIYPLLFAQVYYGVTYLNQQQKREIPVEGRSATRTYFIFYFILCVLFVCFYSCLFVCLFVCLLVYLLVCLFYSLYFILFYNRIISFHSE